MKKTKQSSLSPLYLILGLVIIVGGIVWVGTWKQNKKMSTILMQKETQLFQSKELKLSLRVPGEFQIETSNTGIDLRKNQDLIEIVRNGTQFKNLEGYLEDFDMKRGVIVLSSENIKTNDYEGIKRNEERIVGGQKRNPRNYYFLINDFVYIFSTSSESLYTDLDQIAQSFRYTP